MPKVTRLVGPDLMLQVRKALMTAADLPLHRYPLAHTRSVDDMHAAVQRLYGEHSIEIISGARSFHAQMNFARLQSVGLFYGRYGTDIRVSFPSIAPFIIGVPLTGRGEHVADGVQQTMSLTGLPPAISSGSMLSLNFADDFGHLALYIDPPALMKKLSALIGMALTIPLKFDPSAPHIRPEAQTLRRLIMFLVNEMDSGGPHASPLALAELEQAVMVFYLCGNPSNYSRWLQDWPAAVAPWQVRRAEDYIEANWDQPITVEALALVTNASVRSIFHSFKASRGYSPMMFVKQVRLRHARQMLSHPDAATSVSDVAYACGFNNLGHFAKDYFQAFGERPSGTLNVAKGARRPKGER